MLFRVLAAVLVIAGVTVIVGATTDNRRSQGLYGGSTESEPLLCRRRSIEM